MIIHGTTLALPSFWIKIHMYINLLNQECFGFWLVCAWFLKIAFVWEIGIRVHVRACLCVWPQSC